MKNRLFNFLTWLKVDQKLEIHIPEAFTPERPALNFHHQSFDTCIDEHHLASSLPVPTGDKPSLQNGPDVFISLGVPPATPMCLDDYLQSDRPQLTLHVVSFHDATLVSICWPHICADAMGLRDVVHAWSLMLAGREAEIPPMLSSCEDPMAKVGVDPSFISRHALEEQRLTGLWLFLWGIRFIIDMLWLGKMETRTIFLPRRTVRSLHREATGCLAARYEADTTSTDKRMPFLSEGDVLAAWMTCKASSVLPQSSTRTVGVYSAFDLRGRLVSTFPMKKGQGAYVQNAVFPFTTNIQARDVIARPDALGFVAHAIRRSLTTLTTEPQIHAFARLARASLEETQLPPLFGDTSSFLITCSNWTKTGIFESFDLGPAVLPQASTSACRAASTLKGRPVYYHVQGVSPNNMLARNTVFLIGMPNGDYWLNACFSPKVWREIEADFSMLSQQ